MPIPVSAPPMVLSFAPLDPSGAQGVLADAQAILSMGCHPLAVATGFVASDSSGWTDCRAQEDDWVTLQARAVLEDMPVAAFRVGMPMSVDNVVAIAEIVGDYPEIPLILSARQYGSDPQQDDDEIFAAMIELLIPQATLLVTGQQTAESLLALVDSDEEEAEGEGERSEGESPIILPGSLSGTPSLVVENLMGLGAEFVLLTGTHLNTPQIVNTLFGQQGVLRTDAWDRIPGVFRGAGSTLSAAIAAAVASGLDVAQAVGEAQEYTWQALNNAYRPGMGQLIPDRMFWARQPMADEGDDSASTPTLQ